MKLWIISHESDGVFPCDYYDSAVVAARTEEEARGIDLGASEQMWPSDQSEIKVEYIGTAKKGTKKGVIHESFNQC